MDTIKKNIIPDYVFILGTLGISFLVISMILWFVFYFYFYQSVNGTVNPPVDKKTGYNIIGYTTLVVGIVGFIFCCFLIYGYILYVNFDLKILRRNDPYVKVDEPQIIQQKNPYANLRYSTPIVRQRAPIVPAL